MKWRLLVGLVGSIGLVAAFAQIEPVYELRNVDLTGWDCKPEGAAKTPEGQERNRQKNRGSDLANAKPVEFDTPAFLAHALEYDRQLGVTRRRDMNLDQKNMLARFENETVSLTGWLDFAYQGLPEQTNCNSDQFVDWHLELFSAPSDHAPRVGDATPIICEITPRTESAVYRSGARIQNLAPFLRLPDIATRTESVLKGGGVRIEKLAPSLHLPENNVTPTSGGKAHKVRVTGFLFWDDEHIGPNDVGRTVQRFNARGWHNPWRSTAWEIHPVLKIEDLGTQ